MMPKLGRKLTCNLLASVLFLGSMPASAGLFDFLSGSSEKKSEEKKDPPSPPATANANKGCLSGKAMTGRELMGELRAIRGTFSAKDPSQALSSLILPGTQKAKPEVTAKAKTARKSKTPEASPTTGNSKPPADNPCQQVGMLAQMATGVGSSLGGGTVGSITSFVGDALLDTLISELSYKAIDGFFAQLVDDKDVLDKVSVDVPDISNLSPDLRKSVLNLSAFLVAIKASGAIIDAGQKDYDTAKESYKKVMAAREKASQILADAYFKREQAADLKEMDKAKGSNHLSKEWEDLLKPLEGKSAEDFVKDPRVQSLAIEFMKRSDPVTYRQYTGEFTEMKNHYGAYMRTATGSASMLGFSALFMKKAKSLVEQQGATGVMALSSMVPQAIGEIVSLAPRVKKVLDNDEGMVVGSFSIERDGKIWKQGLSANRALSALDDNQLAAFRSNVVNGPKGYLATLHSIDRMAAAELADRVVSKDSKKLLVTSYHLSGDAAQFSFQQTITAREKSSKTTKDLAQALFFTQQKTVAIETLDEQDKALALAQKDLIENLSGYDNRDLRKLLFATTPDAPDPKLTIADAKMTLADATIRVDSPGIDGLLDQEAMMINRLNNHGITQKFAREASGKTALRGKKK